MVKLNLDGIFPSTLAFQKLGVDTGICDILDTVYNILQD